MSNNMPSEYFQNWKKMHSNLISEEERITKEIYEFNKSNIFENISEDQHKISTSGKIRVLSFKRKK